MTKRTNSGGGLAPTAPPPRSLDDLRLSTDVMSVTDITAGTSLVKCGKPSKATYFRSHPELFTSAFTLYEHEDGMRKQLYLISPAVTELEGVAKRILFQTVITRQGVVGLWPLKLTPPDGSTNSWNESALAARDESLKTWIRMWSDSANAQYTWRAADVDSEFVWPEWVTMDEVILRAFPETNVVRDTTHALVQELLGRL